jgi:hypothetical protein
MQHITSAALTRPKSAHTWQAALHLAPWLLRNQQATFA